MNNSSDKILSMKVTKSLRQDYYKTVIQKVSHVLDVHGYDCGSPSDELGELILRRYDDVQMNIYPFFEDEKSWSLAQYDDDDFRIKSEKLKVELTGDMDNDVKVISKNLIERIDTFLESHFQEPLHMDKNPTFS
jgi:hypothetical protein